MGLIGLAALFVERANAHLELVDDPIQNEPRCLAPIRL
jgi:hypothetical protein